MSDTINLKNDCINLSIWQIFASHGVGGLVGNLLTAIFAQKSVAGFDGSEINGGWLDRHFIQLAYHIADSFAGLAYSFTVTVRSFWPQKPTCLTPVL